jgi:hypothetical protein
MTLITDCHSSLGGEHWRASQLRRQWAKTFARYNMPYAAMT